MSQERNKPKNTKPVVQQQNQGQLPSAVTTGKLKPNGLPPIVLSKFMQQIVFGTPTNDLSPANIEVNRAIAKEMLDSLAPKDCIEGMIVSQLITLSHNIQYTLTMNAQLRPENHLRPEITSQIAKLNKSFTSLVETLMRYRSRDKLYQNLNVGHVDVHQGGQAIVGNLSK